jgi:hypothetical protein
VILVFQCGSNIEERLSIERESSLTDVLRSRSIIVLKKDLRGEKV